MNYLTELSRRMGLFHLTMYGVGLILGAGIYVLVGKAAGLAGGSVWISFVFASIAAIFAGLSYSELSSLFPKSAAEYIFVKRAFKNNFFAFVVGWLVIITTIITAATVSVGFGGYFLQFFNIPIVITAIVLIGILSFVNYFGIRESSWTNIIFTIIEASGLIIIIVIGFTVTEPIQVDYFESPNGLSGIVLGFVLIFFAFIGFESMVNVAEEVKNPSKTIPKAIVLSIVITAIIYILVSVSAVRVLNWEELGNSVAPLANIADKTLGSTGNTLLSAIALFATSNTVLISLIAGSRIFYGIAKEGSLPAIFGKIHQKTKTPWVAIIVIMLVSMGFALVGDIVLIANITVFAVVITFASINLAVIVLRYTESNLIRPFRVPLNIRNFPILPLIGFIISVYMAFQFQLEVILVGLGIIAVGAIIYIVYTKKRNSSILDDKSTSSNDCK